MPFQPVELDVTRNLGSDSGPLSYFNIKFFDSSITKIGSSYADGDDSAEQEAVFTFGSATMTYYRYENGRLQETITDSISGC